MHFLSKRRNLSEKSKKNKKIIPNFRRGGLKQ